MRYFLDLKCIDSGANHLVSIGIVSADGREFYAESGEIHGEENASELFKTQVLANLVHRQPDKTAWNAWHRDGGSGGLFTYSVIQNEVRRFMPIDDKTELWINPTPSQRAGFLWRLGHLLPEVEGKLLELDSLSGPKPSLDHGGINALYDARYVLNVWKLLCT
jgi:hypothetical protein